jgi:tyrosinase
MDRYISPSIELTAAQRRRSFSRADVVFYNVDARGASFVAKVFLDVPGQPPDASPTREDGYAGFFCIFGHGGCFGDEGHCEVPPARDPFDVGPPHGLTPQIKLVDVTTQLKAITGDTVILTVLPISRSQEGPILIDALEFTSLRLLSYD